MNDGVRYPVQKTENRSWEDSMIILIIRYLLSSCRTSYDLTSCWML